MQKTHKHVNLKKNQQGVAIVTLIFFVLIATVYISTAIVISVVNSQAVATTEQGFDASRVAEGALEDTLLRLLRDPTYAGGSFNLEGGNVTVSITGNGIKDISVSVQKGNYKRSFQAQVEFMETEMDILSWKEIF